MGGVGPGAQGGDAVDPGVEEGTADQVEARGTGGAGSVVTAVRAAASVCPAVWAI